MSCNNINIVNVDLSHASIGLMLFNTSYCEISGCNISYNNDLAVYMWFASQCKISGCNISYNNLAVYIWYASQCKFMKNNFIKNTHDVSFSVDYLEIHNNIWERNYFDKKIPFLPKILVGKVKTRYTYQLWNQEFPIYRIGFYFDWFQAQKPYDIGG